MYVIWCRNEGRGGLRVGVSDARYPIPYMADPITIFEHCYVRLMRRWLGRRAKRGWSLERMREACGEVIS
ncbi:hypothetical protein SAMN06275492_1423 [Dethiosulfovibrio salsuginis]|uniref:Uncharacterized protein n=1 Tax=Dethiosulfovibrio salsuginis TaxID=561720 RepID=A0A1X7L0G5_9BACT|nr:hypothetical protein SAMN06275492_1423 [Dethiosulfovibrio salsuginis]